MKIFGASQVRQIDEYTIEHEPIESIDLMERAATSLVNWYVRYFHTDQGVVIFAGPGNNGGDALVMARLLAERQFRVTCYILLFGKLSDDCATNKLRLEELGSVDLEELKEGDPLPLIEENSVLVDGIFGSGLSRPVSGFPGKVIRHINENSGTVIALDLPSGLFGEDNSGNTYDQVIRADHTLTFQFPFLSFFFEPNEPFTGRWCVHDIKLHPTAILETETLYRTIEKDVVKSMLPSRGKFSHKGTFGHALIISGSYGMMGAALLAGESCLRGGAGLVTLHVPRFGYNIIQTGLPEAIVSLDQSDILFSNAPDLAPFSAIGIGPGLGRKQNTERGLRKLLESAESPMVIDADGLNILSDHPEWVDCLPPGTILTPHPKEFDRLAGTSENPFLRHVRQKEFAAK